MRQVASRTHVERRLDALIPGRGAADQRPMNTHTAILKQLVSESSYPIDEAAIAEAILVRSMARRTLPNLVLRGAAAKPQVRSSRPHRGRSFRLARAGWRPPRGREAKICAICDR